MRFKVLLLVPIIFLLSTTSSLANLSLEMPRPELHRHRFPISVYKERLRPKAALFPPRPSVGIADAREFHPHFFSKIIHDYWISSFTLNIVANDEPMILTPVRSFGFSVRIHRARSARAPPSVA